MYTASPSVDHSYETMLRLSNRGRDGRWAPHGSSFRIVEFIPGRVSIQFFVRTASSSRSSHKSDVLANVSEVLQPRCGVAWLAR